MHAPGPRRVVPKSQYGDGVQVLTEDTIGLPIYYPDGPYKGKTILTLIEEVHKPDLGRKYDQRDPRPLDPSPVVQVRLFETFDYGSPSERRVELEVSDVFLPGLICYAELFPYNADFEYDPRIYPDGRPPPTPIQPTGAPDAGRPLACAHTYPPDNLPRQPRIPLTRDAALPLQLHGQRHQNVVLVPGIRGSGKKGMHFVFSDLQVRLTGHFMLKYTVMHLDHTVARAGKAPLAAECWGGVFAVYPSKQHPALRQSTELTNHLSRCGSKLHSRHKQRVGRGSVARLDGGTASPPTPKLYTSKQYPARQTTELTNHLARYRDGSKLHSSVPVPPSVRMKHKRQHQSESSDETKGLPRKRPRNDINKSKTVDSDENWADLEDELLSESEDDEDEYARYGPSKAGGLGNVSEGTPTNPDPTRVPLAPASTNVDVSHGASRVRKLSSSGNDDDQNAALLLLGIGNRAIERVGEPIMRVVAAVGVLHETTSGRGTSSHLKHHDHNISSDIKLASLTRVAVGGYSDIYRGLYRSSVDVAVKRPRFEDRDKVQREIRIKRELSLLASLHHPNILPCLGYCTEFGTVCIVLPWAEKGSMGTYLEQEPDADRYKLLAEVARALVYLHTRVPPVIHGDLHISNVLISADDRALLSDFGLGRVLDPASTSQSTSPGAGRPAYLAPELSDEDGHRSLESDVFAYGMLIVETFSGKPPFGRRAPMAVFKAIHQGERPDRGTIARDDFCDAAWKLVEKCWAHKPCDRPSMSAIEATLRQL